MPGDLVQFLLEILHWPHLDSIATYVRDNNILSNICSSIALDEWRRRSAARWCRCRRPRPRSRPHRRRPRRSPTHRRSTAAPPPRRRRPWPRWPPSTNRFPRTRPTPQRRSTSSSAWAGPRRWARPGPNYFGFVNGATYPVALGASFLVDTWDQNAALPVMSPVAAAIYDVARRWTLDVLGLAIAAAMSRSSPARPSPTPVASPPPAMRCSTHTDGMCSATDCSVRRRSTS